MITFKKVRQEKERHHELAQAQQTTPVRQTSLPCNPCGGLKLVSQVRGVRIPVY